MKTAEEWSQSKFAELGLDSLELAEIEQVVKEIQLDAWKQGMTDAAQVVRDWVDDADPDEDSDLVGELTDLSNCLSGKAANKESV